MNERKGSKAAAVLYCLLAVCILAVTALLWTSYFVKSYDDTILKRGIERTSVLTVRGVYITTNNDEVNYMTQYSYVYDDVEYFIESGVKFSEQEKDKAYEEIGKVSDELPFVLDPETKEGYLGTKETIQLPVESHEWAFAPAIILSAVSVAALIYLVFALKKELS